MLYDTYLDEQRAKFVNSVGGFYIGRYEIGFPDVTSEVGYNIDIIASTPTAIPSLKKRKRNRNG